METLEIKRIGYYPVIGDDILSPLCADCFAENPTEDSEEFGVDSRWGYGHESDTPTHCFGCDALILHHLTKEGYWYIMEEMMYFPKSWNKFRATWIEAYGTDLINYFAELEKR